MSDLISRSALASKIRTLADYDYHDARRQAFKQCLDYIHNMPTIEAVEVVHGEWIAQDDSLTKFMCSSCGGKNYGGHEKFCPNCGADMRKGGAE